MDERPDLLLGIIVTHVAKQQQPVHQPVAGKVASKTWTYSEYQERSSISESPISLHSSMPTMTTASSTIVIHETETIASPASQVNELCLKKNYLSNRQRKTTTTTTVLWPLYRSTCVSRHLS